MIGKTLAHYKIVEKIGAGGMGEVYQATDTKLGRDVALKILPPEFARDSERMARFEREARVLASLNHPGIASIFGIEHEDGVRFLVMELVAGDDLAQRLKRGPVAVPDAVEVARRIAEALEEAHAQGVVHRDLKPANIKVSAGRRVKILDFGLAKAMTDEPQASGVLEDSPTIAPDVTRAGIILGTAAYMSPEQARGQVCDARTDVWAFGCVLYEMLAGRAPFSGETTSDLIAAVLEREPDWTSLPDATPPAVRMLLLRCLRKDANHRLHSIADARIELSDAASAAHSSVSGTSYTDSVESPRAAGTPRWTLLAAAAAAFVLGALVVWLGTRGSTAPAVPSVASGPLARLVIPAPAESPAVPLPNTSSVAISPDGTFVVYVGPASGEDLGSTFGDHDAAATTMLFLRLLDGRDFSPIEGSLGASSPFISPDGRWIGFLDTRRGKLRKIARAGGAPIDLCDAVANFRAAAWTDDGRILFGLGSGGLRAIPEDGGTPRLISTPDSTQGVKTHRFPNTLPGSKAALFTHGRADILSYDDADVALLSLDTGEVRLLVEGGSYPKYVPTGHIVFGRAGNLLAVPFDLDALEVLGPPFSVLEGLITSDGYGSAHYDFSRNGTLVYLRGGPEHYYYEIFTLGTDGRVERFPVAPQAFGDAKISPDGRQVAMSVLGANASLWTYDLSRGTMTRLTDAWDNSSPIWHPDGSITYTSNSQDSEGVWSMAADGAGQPKLLVGDTGLGYPSSWHPDGSLLTVSLDVAGHGADIYTVSGDAGHEMAPLISTGAREFFGMFSPDGRHLAYVSDESGRLEIYVQPFPLTGQKWRLSENGGDNPLWSPDGRKLYYWDNQRLMEVPVETEAGFSPARARVLVDVELSDVQTYDVFPDGERFLVIARATHADERQPIIQPGGHRRTYPALTPDLQVVVNWFRVFQK